MAWAVVCAPKSEYTMKSHVSHMIVHIEHGACTSPNTCARAQNVNVIPSLMLTALTAILLPCLSTPTTKLTDQPCPYRRQIWDIDYILKHDDDHHDNDILLSDRSDFQVLEDDFYGGELHLVAAYSCVTARSRL